jgi:hypothetical protein
MSSLAELTAALRRKDEEKTGIVRQLQAVQELQQTHGVLGKLTVTVTECFFDTALFEFAVEPQSFFYRPEVSPSLMNKVKLCHFTCTVYVLFLTHCMTTLKLKALKEEVELHVKSKEVGVVIKFAVGDMEYSALLDAQEVPDNSSISMVLEALCLENGAKSDVRIKATFDHLEELTRSLTLEIEQMREEIKQLTSQVQAAARGASKKTSAAGAKKTKSAPPASKKTKAAASAPREEEDAAAAEDVDDIDVDGGDEDYSSGIVASIQNAAINLISGAFTHRAVGLFVIASAAIYLKGDNMSV